MYRLLYFIVVIALVAPVGCNRHDDRLWPFGWTKVGEPFDSLTLLMERAHIAYLPIDSLQHYADALSDMAESDPSSTVKDVRARFWQARLKMRNGDYDGAINGFKEALARCDSAKYPYDYKRISWLLGAIYNPIFVTVPLYKQYEDFVSDAQFFEKEGDIRMAAVLNTELGRMMEELGSPNNAIEFYDKGDSLFALAGMVEDAPFGKLNRVLVNLRLNDDSVAAVKAFREFTMDKRIQGRSDIYAIVLGNLYSIGHDTIALRKAYELVKANPNQKAAEVLYSVYLADEMLGRGNLDSAFYYSNIGMANLAEVVEFLPREECYRIRAKLMAAAGRSDSAYQYLLLSKQYHDSVCVNMEKQRVLNVEVIRQIGEKNLPWSMPRAVRPCI